MLYVLKQDFMFGTERTVGYFCLLFFFSDKKIKIDAIWFEIIFLDILHSWDIFKAKLINIIE